MSKYSNILLSLTLVLVLANLALTATVLMNQSSQTAVQTETLDTLIAKDWGARVAAMYNRQDHRGLYALFSPLAKLKISQSQLDTQLSNLFQLFGQIEDSSLVSAVKVAEKEGILFYKLLFNIRVKEVSKRQATLTISLVSKDDKLDLFGVRINAAQVLD